MDETQPILWALSDTIDYYNIPITPFKDMIIGQGMDIHFKGILNKEIVESIFSEKVNGAFIRCWEKFVIKIEDYYEDAIKDLKYYDVDSLVSITQAIVYYRGILNDVRANQYDCLNKQCKVKDLLSLQSEVRNIVKQIRRERAQFI